jgi:hypothetical protein
LRVRNAVVRLACRRSACGAARAAIRRMSMRSLIRVLCESRGSGLLIVGSCEVDVLRCSCPHAESQLKRECSLEHPASWLRDGEPGEEALEGDALA